MFKYHIVIFLVFLFLQNGFSQIEKPDDYLSAEFHKDRREALRQLLPSNSVAVFFANPVRNRANDVDYVYHQDPNFYYLTGYKEPHSVLIIYKEKQNEDGVQYNEAIFVQERNAKAEQWTGKRLGVKGVKEQLGFSRVFTGGDFKDANIDFGQFDKVLIFDFEDDYRDFRSTADLHDLVALFKQKANYRKENLPNTPKGRAYQLIKATDIENSAKVAQNLGRYMDYHPELKKDELLVGFQQANSDELRLEFKEKINLKLAETPKTNIDITTLDGLMGQLREIKQPDELKLLKKAVEISAIGQIEMMKAMHPDMSETEIQGIHEFVYKKYGAEYEGYPSIVGAGHNGCILHYIDNIKPKVGSDLVLMDLGAEYHGYTADVTRTIPADGTFSPEQKAIYEIVYNAQEAGIAMVKPGSTFAASYMATRRVVNEGLLKLGIIKSIDEEHDYYPHGSSHYIGLDVHDAGTMGEFKENMVLTVEPGIYIPENSPCDKKWWGIAVRIEDDILVTKDGPVNLSARAPRKVEEIEKMMKEPSALDDFKLPKLDE
ncbi:MAG: Xaa-Pro aminopeptidase [Flavobacteriales bacterium]|nr:MAG: Xaa-Pro aminopeptidase [Flavobacteriales bacterium]PIE49309.1 MAG: Xaa-Pro aminopeptidase [Flavobacteriales bacterium]